MVSIEGHSGIYTLRTEQLLNTDLETAWEFFSSPSNLVKITPKSMAFEITSGEALPMYPGQIISYKVSPFPGVRASWVTEITHVKDREFFVDEQRFGPYSMWHHEHVFKQTDKGLMMWDKVSYKLPFGILGHMVHPFMVKNKLTEIFSHRYTILEEIFPA